MHAAVIGAGWAGCAAAATLARLGHRVTVFETAPVAGGRARRVVRAGLPIDNGQHLLLGAYVQTRNVMAVVNGDDGETDVVRRTLVIEPLADDGKALRLRARRLPAPFGLLTGLLTTRGLSPVERLGVIRWFRRLQKRDFRCPADMTVAELIAEGPVAADRLWGPLCLAALNTPVDRASAQVFANVLRAAFASDGDASDFVFASTDLSALFPDAALGYVEARGGRIALRTRARIVNVDSVDVIVDEERHNQRFDAAVLAVGPHQLDASLVRHPAFAQALDAARGLAYEPIATIWLGYGTRTPLPGAIARLDDAPGQWVVDRTDVLPRARDDASRPALSQLVAVVISASGPHDALPPAELAAACDAQLRRLVPRWPPLVWSQTIVEQRATYACTPQRPLPATALPHPRVALAGDWIDTEFPATLEAAVRTGVTAAMALDEGLA
jgi:squalene-associated FAD-dependent desaturase